MRPQQSIKAGSSIEFCYITQVGAMQVNNVVCRCDKLSIPKREKPCTFNYRGNRAQIGKSSVTIFVRKKNIHNIFFEINFAEDLSVALSEHFQAAISVRPRISNVQGSKTFNFERTGKRLRNFISELNEITNIDELRISQEQNVFSPIALGRLLEDETWENNFMGATVKANKGKLTCKIQINKDKSKFLGSFIITEFGEVTQKFNQMLQKY